MDKEYTEAVFSLAGLLAFFGVVPIMVGTIVFFQEGAYSHFFSVGGFVLGGVAGFVGYCLSETS